MTEAATWVIGAGGLLGSHVAASLQRRGGAVLTSSVPWHDRKGARSALGEGIRALRAHVGRGPWNIAWCAGAGIIATPETELAAEVDLVERFLADLASSPLAETDGAVFLASSAGGVYAGSPVHAPFTEHSPVGPLVSYGRAKLAMEAAVKAFSDQTGAAALVARIANLYGPGQDLTKPQGLVSQLCLAQVTGEPLTIYVPLDTMRDYVFADDCGNLIAAGVAGLRQHVDRNSSRAVTKIIASGQTTTIGALIAESGRQYKRRPRVVVKAPFPGTGQVVDLRLRSVVWPELDAHLQRPLTEGMAKTAADVGWRTRRA